MSLTRKTRALLEERAAAKIPVPVSVKVLGDETSDTKCAPTEPRVWSLQAGHQELWAVPELARQRVCIFNFANATHAGLNFPDTECSTQEEVLLRAFPDAYLSLSANKDALYPLAHTDDVIYTPPVPQVGHGPTGLDPLPAGTSFSASFITAAAPEHYDYKFNLARVRNALRAVIQVPRQQGGNDQVLVLGAWGVGAFMPRNHVWLKQILPTLPEPLRRLQSYKHLMAHLVHEAIGLYAGRAGWEDVVIVVPDEKHFEIFKLGTVKKI